MIINTPEAFKAFMDRAYTETLMAVDTETTGLRPFHGDHIIGASFLFESDLSTYYIPVRHEYPSPDVNLKPGLLFSHLGVLFQKPELTIVLHNAKFDLKFFEKEGVLFKGKQVLDTQILAHLWNENEHRQGGGYRLKEDLATKYLGADAMEEKNALMECAANWKESRIAPIREELEQVESVMNVTERAWKAELKEDFKAQLSQARQFRRTAEKDMKAEQEGSEHFIYCLGQIEVYDKEIAKLKGIVDDINARNPKDYLHELPDYAPLLQKRKRLMERIAAIRDIPVMEKLACYPLETVACYAEADTYYTYWLYRFFRFGETP